MLDLVFIDELCDVDQTALIRMRTFSLTLCQTHRKKLTLTHYKTLMSLGGYCKIANIS